MKLTKNYVIGGLVLAGLIAGLVYMFQDGPDDPPPIIVSNGGSIHVGLDSNASAPGQFKHDLFKVWYYQPSSHEHTPTYIHLTVVGAKDDNNNACTNYDTDKRIFFEYGSGNTKRTFETSIGWVPEVKFWDHLKFDLKGNKGDPSAKSNGFDIDYGETVYLETMRIQTGIGSNSGPMVKCTFQSNSTQSTDVSVTFRQIHQ